MTLSSAIITTPTSKITTTDDLATLKKKNDILLNTLQNAVKKINESKSQTDWLSLFKTSSNINSVSAGLLKSVLDKLQETKQDDKNDITHLRHQLLLLLGSIFAINADKLSYEVVRSLLEIEYEFEDKRRVDDPSNLVPSLVIKKLQSDLNIPINQIFIPQDEQRFTFPKGNVYQFELYRKIFIKVIGTLLREKSKDNQFELEVGDSLQHSLDQYEKHFVCSTKGSFKKLVGSLSNEKTTAKEVLDTMNTMFRIEPEQDPKFKKITGFGIG